MNFIIPDFSKAKVLIVGDVMLDRYYSGKTDRISPEAPVPVVAVKSKNECPGGAANVALNAKTLGARTFLLGICGDDEAGHMLEEKLLQAGIECDLIKDAALKTIVKLRVLGAHQQLLRLDFESTPIINHAKQLIEKFTKVIGDVDVVILSDYAKGTLAHAKELIAIANQHGKPVFVDPKTSDLHHYDGAYLITPNLKEFQEIVGPCPDEATLIAKGRQLMASYQLPALLVTRSEQGMTLFQQNQPEIHFSAHQLEVFDVTGAGDTVIAVMSAALAAGSTLPDAVRLANLAAGISVRKLNAATVTVAEMRREIWHHKQSFTDKHIVTEEELLILVEDAKAHGETVVMTNGCFDILHPGHITYLEAAKQLGDRLIVAVNSDESVRQLNKGDNRPLNSLKARMEVLAGLRAIDWIVPFAEETPERLIGRVLPNVLVKGKDYKVEEIAGHKDVLAHGGQVITIDLVPGFSTTNIVKKIKGQRD